MIRTMTNLEYWERRKAREMYGFMDDAEKTAAELSELYIRASLEVQREARLVFVKFRDRYQLTDAEARKVLQAVKNKGDIEEIMRRLKENPGMVDVVKQYESQAYAARLKHFALVQKNLETVLRQLAVREDKMMRGLLKRIGDEAYTKELFDIQKYANAAYKVKTVSEAQLESILNRSWSGGNYSSRLWSNSKQLAAELKEQITLEFLAGKSQKHAADAINERFASGYSNARRLIRTETTYVAMQMKLEAMKTQGVEKYIYCAILDLRTSNICRKLDKKIFPVEGSMPGDPEHALPPMHPYCRSTILEWIPATLLKKLKQKAYDPVTGETTEVPGDMTYGEWYERYVEGRAAASLQTGRGKSRNLDKEQYERYLTLLKSAAEMPKTFDEFKQLKYNNRDEWDRLKLKYKDQKLCDRIRRDYNLQIHGGRQGKHIIGHNNYGVKSYLLPNIDPQELVNRYAGSGEIRRTDSGRWIGRQFFENDSYIGIVVDGDTGEKIRTKYFSVEYSKEKGTHIVPRLKK